MARLVLLLAVVLIVPACGGGSDQPSAESTAAADAPAAATQVSSGQVAEADRAAILTTLKLSADANGQVLNECGDRITPQLLGVDVGEAVGPAVLVVMTGGPSLASCYGDGPGLTLLRRDATVWKQIYSSRGGSLVVMKESHNGARDLVFGGPGLSHPAFEWTGSSYEPAGREVSDDGLGGATFLP
jgi:hypothetical protein